MDSAKAEILAGTLGAATFCGTLVLLNLPLLLSVASALGVYTGLNLLLGGKAKQGVQNLLGSSTSAVWDELKARIEHEEQFVQRIGKKVPQITDTAIKQSVIEICDISQKIFENFRTDPDDLKQAQRFLIHFSKLWPIIENYLHLASDPDRRSLLTDADTIKLRTTLEKFVQNLKEAYRAFHENDLQQLRLTTSVLERMIDLDTKTRI
jgi:5-bromo-4-chloroindolyl phosphate hydrolysis protein